MKKLLAALLTVGLILSFAISAFAVVPGDGEWDPDTEPSINLENRLSQKQVPLPKETLEIIAAKEAALYNSPAKAYPTSVRIGPMVQYPQEAGNYCGPSAVKTVLNNEWVTISQKTLAGSSYLKTDANNGTPWYLANGLTLNQYPTATTLNALGNFYWNPYPFRNLGAAPLKADLKPRMVDTLSQYHGVLADGASKASSSHASHLPGYPNKDVAHWLAVDGYANSGETIWIVDPASGSSHVSWSSGIPQYYSITLDKFTAFVAPRGIIW